MPRKSVDTSVASAAVAAVPEPTPVEVPPPVPEVPEKHDETEQTDAGSGSEDKTHSSKRKPRVNYDLNAVLEAVKGIQVDAKHKKKAITLLEHYIEKYGVGGGKVKVKRAPQVDENGEKILNPYQKFIKEDMIRIKQEQPDLPSKEVMKMAVINWNSKKH